MKSSIEIVEGGGWITRQTIGRPKARLFGFLSAVWFGVALSASFPFWDGWPESFGPLEWLCGALLLPQPVFIALTLVFLATEPPRPILEQHRNPDYDIRNLY